MKATKLICGGLVILIMFLCSANLSIADPLDNWHRSLPHNNLSEVGYGNGRFVAVGDNGAILTSSDGITWTERTSGTSDRLNGVAYGNAIFVAVGVNGNILTSPDGLDWTKRSSGVTDKLNDIVYGNSTFFAVGDGTILTSPDGIIWTTIFSGTSYKLRAATYGDGTFVATGENGVILTSPGGFTWTIRISGTSYNLNGVTYYNGTFVAVGDNGTLLTSTDGVAWVGRTSVTSNILSGVAFGNSTFVAVGDNGTVLTSSNGVTWTTGTSGFNGRINGITYANYTFVAVGDNGGILTSPDGVTWTIRIPPTSVKRLNGIAYGNGTFVAVGVNGDILTSPDGATWTKILPTPYVPPPVPPVANFSGIAIAYGNGTFVDLAQPDIWEFFPIQYTIFTSPNGEIWTMGYTRYIITHEYQMLNKVTYCNNTFVAVGGYETSYVGFFHYSGYILTSIDGVSWKGRESGTSDSLNGVAYGNGIYVAVGESGTVLTSIDLDVWTKRNSGTSYNFRAIAYGDGTFVAVGESGIILTSNDGVTWKQGTSGVNDQLNDVAYGYHNFAAVGKSGTILTSPDGISWTIRSSRNSNWLYGVTYSKSTFVVVGEGVILQSEPITNIPEISITPTSLNFGDVNVESTPDKIVTVRNDGNANLVIGTITSPSPPFIKQVDNCSDLTIPPNETCTIAYRFAPTSAGSFSSNSNIPSNDPDKNQVTVSLNGVGIAESITTPSILTGPVSGITGVSYSYTTGGSTSSLGHTVEYQFDWKGDGSDLSPWGSATQSKIWTVAGTYNVRARARCATHTDVISSWSGSISVNISQASFSNYTVTTNPPGLRITVDSSNYTAPQTFNWTLGSTHTLSAPSPQSGVSGTRYVFSSWSDGGAQTHTITAPSSSTTYTATFSTQYELTINSSPGNGGTVTPYPMRDQSGIACVALVGVVCAGYYNSGTSVTLTATPNTCCAFSSWSGDLSGTANPTSITMNSPKNVIANFTSVPEIVSTPNTPSGPTSGTTGTSYTYSTGGSTSNLGHTVQYFFDWGDGTNSGWLDVGTTSASHSWSNAGTYIIKAQARCATDTTVISNWSSGLSVVISSSTVSVHCDFNGDGKTDILWRNKSTGQNVVWFIDGATYMSYVELMQVADTNWQIVGTSDFNGDGKTDILWRNKSTGQNVVWLMDGVNYGSYAWFLEVADLNWEIVGTGDFNGDGKTDILWRNRSTGQNVVWLMNGVAYSSYAELLQVPDTNWKIVGTGDFNGDGKTDILWRNRSTGQNVVWFMDGVLYSSYAELLQVTDTNWQIVGTGDFNSDGKTDIVWRNKTNGQNIILLMSGTTLSSFTWLPEVSDTNWEIVGPK